MLTPINNRQLWIILLSMLKLPQISSIELNIDDKEYTNPKYGHQN